jgi:hypothetical protein
MRIISIVCFVLTSITFVDGKLNIQWDSVIGYTLKV